MISDKRYFRVILSRIPLWKWSLGLVLFVAAQMAGTIHAEVHEFHDHGVYCDAFENAAEPAFPDYGFVAVFTVERVQSQPLLSAIPAGNLTPFEAFQSRAPPIS